MCCFYKYTYTKEGTMHRGKAELAPPAFAGELEEEGLWEWRCAGDVKLHAQLVVQLVVEAPLGGHIRFLHLAHHGRLQLLAELHWVRQRREVRGFHY